MPKTAVVNPRRRRRRKKNPTKRSAPRRRNTGFALVEREPNRRRRGKRRRYYGAARRRRNPASLGSRQRNGFVGFNEVMDIVPPATAGVWAARWALAQAGEFEEGQPGFKHAIAMYLAATFGADLIGSVFGQGKASYARIAAFGFAGDLFMRKRFMKDSEWVQKNISLAGIDDQDSVYGYSQGRDYQTMGAASFVDAVGNTYVQTEHGWALAGDDDEQQLYQDEQGNVFALNGFTNSSPIAGLGSFTNSSPIGAVRASSESSFGYA